MKHFVLHLYCVVIFSNIINFSYYQYQIRLESHVWCKVRK